MFARWVDLNIAVWDTFELNISMIFIFVLEETYGAYNTLGQRSGSHIFKEEK
jgi:hypothetical protein